MKPHIRLLPIVIALAYLGYQYMSSQKFINPETGKAARLGMSAQQETALGLQSYQQVLQESQTVDSGPESCASRSGWCPSPAMRQKISIGR